MGCCQSKQSKRQALSAQPCRPVTIQQRAGSLQNVSAPQSRCASRNNTNHNHQKESNASKVATQRRQHDVEKEPTVIRTRSVRHEEYLETRSIGGTTTRHQVPEDLSPAEAKRRHRAMKNRARCSPGYYEQAARYEKTGKEMDRQLIAIGAKTRTSSSLVIEAAFKAEETRAAENARIMGERDTIRKRQEKELKKNFSEEKMRKSIKGKERQARSL